MSVTGRKNINLPIIPGQNKSGAKGASVVNVPENTGRKTSPAAILAAFTIGILPLSKIRCVFSITTMASSTTIPNPNRKENKTIMFMVKLKPNIPPKIGIAKKAINMERGTEEATKMAFVTPIKNIRITVTRIKPMIMVLIRSCRVTRVWSDWSPVILISRPLGNTEACISLIIALILSDASMRFCPERFFTFKVITFFPYRRA
ncbi:hypothetical protein D9M68_566060 [compost metagenome]